MPSVSAAALAKHHTAAVHQLFGEQARNDRSPATSSTRSWGFPVLRRRSVSSALRSQAARWRTQPARRLHCATAPGASPVTGDRLCVKTFAEIGDGASSDLSRVLLEKPNGVSRSTAGTGGGPNLSSSRRWTFTNRRSCFARAHDREQTGHRRTCAHGSLGCGCPVPSAGHPPGRPNSRLGQDRPRPGTRGRAGPLGNVDELTLRAQGTDRDPLGLLSSPIGGSVFLLGDPEHRPEGYSQVGQRGEPRGERYR